MMEYRYDVFENDASKYGIAKYDSNGNWIRVHVSPEYDYIWDIHYLDDKGHANVKLGDKCFLIDLEGKKLSEDYDNMKHFEDGVCGVEKNHKWGYINETGELIISPKFENGGSFYDGIAIVNFEGKKWLINKKVEILTEEGYDSILPEDDENKKFTVVKDGKEKTIYLH